MLPAPLPDPHDPQTRADAVRAARARSVDPAVLAALSVSTPAQERARAALTEGVCVVTGQQAGLFGGPLYTLHKAAAAVVNARALEAETGVPCAPVFWLQDEDHDFDEIATAHLLDAAGEVVGIGVDGLPEEAGRSVCDRRFGPSVERALDAAQAALTGLPHAGEVLAVLRGTHGPDVAVSAAFRRGIERLFAEHGLLVVDPADLREAARPVHARAIAEARPIAASLRAQGDALAAAGRPVPVHVRPASPLSFVHPDGASGPRYRVEPLPDGSFRLCGTDRSISAAQVEAGPHSTSALLRPILQDTLLPTAAYVGGPGELAYLAQMPALWGAFGLPVPLVVHRARFALVDAGCRRALGQLGLTLADLSAPRDVLLERLGRARGELPDPDALLAELTSASNAVLARFGPQAAAVDPGLGRSVARTATSLQRSAGKLVTRYRRSLARADGVTVGRLDRVLAQLAPNGQPQERVLAWPSFAARVGIDALVARIVEAAVPWDATLREIEL